ncbi:MAG: fumarylacetoacetate hydrolase family protein [Alphaproteobacteria bacterium]|nr:fumarylacetoacetate hydrolase family protein [Alphaproteobacteria bacterium]
MKIISFRDSNGESFGVVDDDGGIVDVGRKGPYPSLRAALAAEGLDEVAALAAGAAPDTTMDAVTLLPVIPDPDKIVCAGMNYKDHVEEFDREMPENVTLFVRLTNTLVAHGDDIVRPSVSDNFDFEGELSLIIGKGGRHIAEADVLSHIAGYTCFLDGSVRDYQGHSVTAGKNFHRTGPLGPWMVTADQIPDPAALELTTRLNGEVMQNSTTDMLIYSIPNIVSYISDITPLEPGDVIATGTPAGVGNGRTPKLFMKAGDTIEVEISGIGTLRNTVIDE